MFDRMQISQTGAHAQQTLPTIDVGSRLRAGVRAASHGPVVGTPAVSDDSDRKSVV